MENLADYNPYFDNVTQQDHDSSGNPVYNLFLTDEFLRDINRPQTLKLFKAVLSGFLYNESGTNLPQPNIYYADINNVENISNGRSEKTNVHYPNSTLTKQLHGNPFDGNEIGWRSTIVKDDVLICHYFNQEITAYTNSNDVNELIYFLYDIIEPCGTKDYVPELPEESEIVPAVFKRPVYKTIAANKIAAIGRTRGVDTAMFGYTHNWFYFNLQGYDIKCRFNVPSQEEAESGYTDNAESSKFTDLHFHTTGIVTQDAPNSYPPNMRDAHDRFMGKIKSCTENCRQYDMSVRVPEADVQENMPEDSSAAVLPSGAVIATGSGGVEPVFSFDGSRYADHMAELTSETNRRLITEDSFLDKGV